MDPYLIPFISGIIILSMGAIIIYYGIKWQKKWMVYFGIVLLFIGPGLIVYWLILSMFSGVTCYAPIMERISPMFILTFTGLREQYLLKYRKRLPDYVLEKITTSKGKSHTLRARNNTGLQ
ncbi:MAG: hypothetical protein QW505_00160 [Thermoplasmata archaeon]